MEEQKKKRKELLRRLTIISIPFVFVAIPSGVIIVGMLFPHATTPPGSGAGGGSSSAPGTKNHSLSMLSTMTGGQMILSCRADLSGNWEYFHYFILDPYKPRQAFFQPPPPQADDPYVIYCKWGYMGNFLQNVVVFNSTARYAPQCRVDNGGCRYLFQDGHMFRVTGKHGGAAAGAPAPAMSLSTRQQQRREKTLLGDVVLRECRHVMGVFPAGCWYKRHDHEYVGKIIGRWKWWFNY